MEKRRGHGEGSVYQRKDKSGKLIPNSWVAQGTYDGKRKTFVGESRKEALTKMKEYENTQQAEEAKETPEVTFREFSEDWLQNVKKRTLKQASYYERIILCWKQVIITI